LEGGFVEGAAPTLRHRPYAGSFSFSSLQVESVLRARYSAEHMFDSLRIAEPNEQGADRWI
jgi:hypothetical protein